MSDCSRGVAVPPGGTPRTDFSQASTRVVRRRSTTGSTSATVTGRPSSAVSEVTPASRMPQGTIRSKYARSQSQLMEKPCRVTPAGDPDADGGHLAGRAAVVLRHPDAAAPLDPAGGQPELGAHVDQQLLGAADVGDHVDRVGQPQDRVADELTRAVPGDLAAPVDVDDGRAVRRTVPRLGALAGGVDARVLQQQHRVAALAGHHGLVQPALLVPGAPGSRGRRRGRP